jgi:replication factor C subunit 3/5
MKNNSILSKDILPWVEKYRPRNLNEVIGHKNILKILNNYLEKRNLPHLLFYGPPGTGKTSIIISYARQLYGSSYPFMVMELNASDERGIEIVRSRIKQFVMSDNVFFKGKKKEDIFKLVILDETDAMTDDAQAILRNIVEKYTNNARFCLICNYIKKINPALQSRCTSFKFSPINKVNMKKKINYIIEKENIKTTKKGIDVIIDRSCGDMRKALNILQMVSMSYNNNINDIKVNNCLCYISRELIEKIFISLVKDNFEETYKKLKNIKKSNYVSILDIIKEISLLFNDMIINDKKVDNIVLDNDTIISILNKLYMIEFNSHYTQSGDIELMALIGIFKININKN